jgi:DNA modification methylase
VSRATVEEIPVTKLRPNPKNARTHSKKQIRQIANSIERFGFNSPIIADAHYLVLAGHGRLDAAKLLGRRTVPTIVVRDLSEAERRAYSLADNKIAENAGWDRPTLAVELKELAPLLADAGLTIDITGFHQSEVDSLMGDLVDAEQDPADEVPTAALAVVTGLGDVWRLGRHRLKCGNALAPADMQALMQGERAAMVFTDPPYNLRVSSIQGRGKIKHSEFVAGSGEMSPAQFAKFLTDAASNAANHSKNGAIHFICMDWKHMGEMLAAGESVYGALKNLIVWAKTNAGQGTFYRSQHELIFVWKCGDEAHANNFELGQFGRRRSNLWTYAGVNTFRSGRMEDLAAHPTVKPVAMVADAMRDCSSRGAIVLDPFMGSGTTILAAERVGRRAYGLELDPRYVDTAVRRWQNFTKRDAVLERTGETFDEREVLVRDGGDVVALTPNAGPHVEITGASPDTEAPHER